MLCHTGLGSLALLISPEYGFAPTMCAQYGILMHAL